MNNNNNNNINNQATFKYKYTKNLLPSLFNNTFKKLGNFGRSLTGTLMTLKYNKSKCYWAAVTETNIN